MSPMQRGSLGSPSRSACWASAMALAASPWFSGAAVAHEIIPGVTGFASLLLHPFVGVETALLMLGLALVVGAAERRPRPIVVAAILVAGAVVGVLLQPSAILVPGLWRVPLVLALVLGAVAATGWSVPPPALAMLALLVATASGIAVSPERPGVQGRGEAMIAVVAAVLIVLLAVGYPRAWFDRLRPVRLAGQILGAWIVAISLLGMAIWLR